MTQALLTIAQLVALAAYMAALAFPFLYFGV
jgi:hypothetical protein